jgi:hypothetical protein
VVFGLDYDPQDTLAQVRQVTKSCEQEGDLRWCQQQRTVDHNAAPAGTKVVFLKADLSDMKGGCTNEKAGGLHSEVRPEKR